MTKNPNSRLIVRTSTEYSVEEDGKPDRISSQRTLLDAIAKGKEQAVPVNRTICLHNTS